MSIVPQARAENQAFETSRRFCRDFRIGAGLKRANIQKVNGHFCHICQNHPFADGNKRTALAAALVSLDINGVVLEDAEDRLYEIMRDIAAGKAAKQDAVRVFRELAVLPDRSSEDSVLNNG